MDVIIPVHNMAELLDLCVSPVVDQLADGDRLTVVDDASTDQTGDIARQLGANVLRLDRSRGPYFARHAAAAQSTASDLLFIDGRSRALPGLLQSHRTMLSRDGVALSCTETLTRSGRTLAERVSARRQPFALTQYIGAAGRLDYFPTCNLGVSADAYRQVGGFRHMRSGGDADLCWRIQKMGLGGMATDARVLMEWVPRDSMRDLLEQWYRYGKSTCYLERIWPDQSMLSNSDDGIDWKQMVLASRGVDLIASAAFAAGLWRGRGDDSPPPVPYQ